MHNILLEIIEKKKEDLKKNSFLSLRGGATKQSQTRSPRFARDDKFMFIAEIKFASPTNPNLGSKKELLERAKLYEKAGADAISIITEPHFFKGDVEFISQVKKEVTIPILQKDFVIDERQIYQAKGIGSDALLLIARLLDKDTLKNFVRICKDLEIEPVVEINNEDDLEKAVTTGTNIIAVNARDLETFQIDVNKACRLMKKIPDKFIKFGFSGIHSSNEVQQYKNAGAKAVLVGTSLMKTKNIKIFISSLRGGATKQSQTRSPRFARDDNGVKVKICGVRSLENANAAIAAGADFLGFNFVPTSKRYIDPKDAKKIINKFRTKSVKLKNKLVGVFQNQSVDEVNKIAETLDLDFVQLHGEEDKEYMKKIKRKIIKRIVIPSEGTHRMVHPEAEGSHTTKQNGLKRFLDSLSVARNDKLPYVLIDREVQGEGEIVSLEKAAEISQKFPTFFSGGLTPENVSEVVKKVEPFAVDVAGGIETDGEIDNEKVKTFIQNAKNIRHSGEEERRLQNPFVTAVRDSGQARMTEEGKDTI